MKVPPLIQSVGRCVVGSVKLPGDDRIEMIGLLFALCIHTKYQLTGGFQGASASAACCILGWLGADKMSIFRSILADIGFMAAISSTCGVPRAAVATISP